MSKGVKISNDDCSKYKIDNTQSSFDITNTLKKYFIEPIAKIINNNIQISESEVRKLIDTEYKYFDEFIKIYNIAEIENIDENTKIDWRISLDVNSYNVETPEKPYPDNLFYGESYTFLLYRNENGEELQTCYWDD